MLKSHATLVRYILVGGSAYLVEMGTLYGLHHGLGLGPLASVAISFWVGFIVAFVLQKTIVFKNYERGAKVLSRQLGIYSLLIVWNYLFTLVMVKLLSDTFSVFIIRTGVIAIITLWNFYLYKRHIFKSEDVVLAD
jgi:putative flippase GtrA